ncbi:ABC transporter ATP-binding protein [Hutsoniella sourekii]|uniref:ABC transporter ATP-binding protein n=1 Tax=Hutsoniella sourekii TaxID=87650 RepID=UPI0004884E40|nr:ABC transporter ATP-binding protein [Hutsoniella sourekii]
MLAVEHLSKSFGDVQAVQDVSFELEPGSIMGMIGQNGSGKTTLFRLILGFLSTDGPGRVMWKGEELSSKHFNEIGYLPEERGLYDKMTVEEQIIYFAQLRGMAKSDVIDRLDSWLDRFAVRGKSTDPIKSLSKGNQQKVQLIATLIHEPKLIILDEPFSGLDPVNASYLVEGVKYLRDQGSAIIFSSHNMTNVEELCDHLTMVHFGKRVLYGSIAEVKQAYGRTRLIIQHDQWDQERLSGLPGVLDCHLTSSGAYQLNLASEEYGPQIFDLVSQGEYLPVFAQVPKTLDEIFRLKVGESNE